MNARVTPPAVTPPSPSRMLRVVSGRDREFFPAALEILETPPPPLPIALIGTICLVALVAVVWSIIGRLDFTLLHRARSRPPDIPRSSSRWSPASRRDLCPGRPIGQGGRPSA